MPNNEFVKGTCEYCDGHLEFMPEAVGQSITCPHCGKLIILKADGKRKKSGVGAGILVGIIIIVCLAGAGLAGWYFLNQKALSKPEAEKSPASTTNLTAKTHSPAPAPEPKPVATTNDFAILPYKLEKTAGSSLVYVTGAIRNLSDRQRFGVKIEFGLFDTNDLPAGSATDYQSVMEPRAVWSFHALALGSKTASVQLNSIAEDK
jgi:hypothetical protein